MADSGTVRGVGMTNGNLCGDFAVAEDLIKKVRAGFKIRYEERERRAIGVEWSCFEKARRRRMR